MKKFAETEKLKYEFVLVYTTEYYVTAFPQQPWTLSPQLSCNHRNLKTSTLQVKGKSSSNLKSLKLSLSTVAYLDFVLIIFFRQLFPLMKP